MGWIAEGISGLINDIITDTLNFLGDIIGDIFNKVAEINLTNENINNASSFTLKFGIAFIIMIATWKYFSTYVIESNGDPDSDPLDIAVRASQAIAIAACNNEIFKRFMVFSKQFAKELSESSGTTQFKATMNDFMTKATPQNGVATIIFLLTILIGVITFTVVAAIRGAELGLMKILLPIFASDLVNTTRERWNLFFTTYVITFMSFSLQLFCWKMFLYNFLAMGNGDEGLLKMGMSHLYTLGWMFLMIKAPKWLEKFTYTTGLGTGATGAAKNLGSQIGNQLLSKLVKGGL